MTNWEEPKGLELAARLLDEAARVEELPGISGGPSREQSIYAERTRRLADRLRLFAKAMRDGDDEKVNTWIGTFLAPQEDSVEWKCRDPVDGDPIWIASLGPMYLTITVGCEWVWEWEIDSKPEGDVARGTVWAADNDTDFDAWDYQNVERAQKRCEAAARALQPFLTSDLPGAPGDRCRVTPPGGIARASVVNSAGPEGGVPPKSTPDREEA